MSWITDALEKAKQALGFGDAGGSKGKCPLQETGLVVVVEREDLTCPIGAPAEGVIVDISGKSPFSKKTNKDGVASFKPVEPDTYKIKLKLPPSLADDYQEPGVEEEGVTLGQCSTHLVEIVPLVNLKVKVVERRKDAKDQPQEVLLDGVTVHIEGKASKDASTPKDASGWAWFRKIKRGEYKISVTSMGSHSEKYKAPFGVSTTFSAGEREHEVTLVVGARGKLQVVLLDKEDKPIPSKVWELLSPIRANGKTAADGLIKVENIALDQKAGELRVDMGPPAKQPAKPTPAPAPAATDPPANPPPIKADHFKDKAPEAKPPDPTPGVVEWSLKLGLLPDYDNDDGVKSRLQNLGFGCNSSSDKDATAFAVKSYQMRYLKKRDGKGEPSEIKDDILKRHDNP